jgi:rhodanese-related sulfurtransferase
MAGNIERDELRRRIAAGVQLVDVLPAEEYEAQHLPGAISIPLKTLNGETAARLRRDRPVITYCWNYT